MKSVSRVKYEGNLKKAIKKSIELIGGFDKFNFNNKIVLVKPNYNTADPYPASSDNEFVKAAIELIKEAGARKIILGESSTHFLNTREVMEEKKVFDLVKNLGVEVIVFDEHPWVKKRIKEGKYLKEASIPALVEKVDKLVFLPCLKTHRSARFTMSLKLSIGLIEKNERLKMHLWNLENKIAELASLFNPDLVIMDARKCFITEGPETGQIREPNLIMASTDRIAIDVEGLKILKSYPAKNRLNMEIWEFPQIKRAVELNIGVKSEREYKIING